MFAERERKRERETERQRWHIRPEGTSLLECLASLPPLPPPCLPLSSRLSLIQSQGRSEDKAAPALQRLPRRALRFLLSHYAMIQCSAPLQIFPHKFIARPIKATTGEIIYITPASQCNRARCRLSQRRQMCQVPPVEGQPGRH